MQRLILLAYHKASAALRFVQETARLMIGVPDYETYLVHMKQKHPEREPMTYAAFFRNRQDARYGGKGRGGFRCC